MEVKEINNQFDYKDYNNIYKNTSNSLDKETNSFDEKYIINKGDKKYTEEELINSIESANKELIVYNRKFEFSIHEKTKHIMVKVIDVATDEVIREIPPEKILDLVASLWEISGLIVDERV